MKAKYGPSLFLALALALLSLATAWAAPLDYSQPGNWAWAEQAQQKERPADVFLIAPTVAGGGQAVEGNADVQDEAWRQAVQGALAGQLGLYQQVAACFAPYYQQAAPSAYRLPEKQRERCLELAYGDVKAALTYYLAQNPQRPFILAGAGQGGELVLRLLKDRSIGKNKKLRQRLIAAYASGCTLTAKELKAHAGLKLATGELDNDCLILFTSEAPAVEESPLLPKGIRTLAVNPLNWQKDGTPATRQQNLGACIFDQQGKLLREEAHFSGGYLDRERGTLKLPYVDPAEYKSSYPAGVYAAYDWQFCYRNLQKNVKDRTTAYLERQKRP